MINLLANKVVQVLLSWTLGVVASQTWLAHLRLRDEEGKSLQCQSMIPVHDEA